MSGRLLRGPSCIALGLAAQAIVTGMFYALATEIVHDAGIGYAVAYIVALAACGAAATFAVGRDWMRGTAHPAFVVAAAVLFLSDTAIVAISLYTLQIDA